jgi:signal transduction histidine kinase/CheY-like chemotaxis protein
MVENSLIHEKSPLIHGFYTFFNLQIAFFLSKISDFILFFLFLQQKKSVMSPQMLLIIAIIALGAVAFFVGRKAYQQHVRTKRRLQMGQIFTNITHELLTPLTVISASVDHLREEAPQQEHDYDLVQLNIQRMVRLLQQILETSKSQAGELKLKVSNGDVMQYIHDTALCLEPLMAQKGLQFSIECSPQSMMGWIDTDKLDKIIYNLLSNAAKYTDQGKVQLKVQTSRNYDHIYIKVRDTGSGIPKDKMKNLFERFYDGEYRQHKTIGTGLGLALTRDLVYLHKGKIDCESEEGKGTTFTISLPITKEAFLPEQIDEEHKIDFNIPKNTITDISTVIPDVNEDAFMEETDDDNAYRILIVEDNPELLMLMRHAMKENYRVFVAQNGKDALDIVKKTSLDLIVSDVMMPEMDGLELTATLKGDNNYKHLPIVLLTAKTQEENEQEALRIGADDYLTKPFRLRDLKLRIDNIIENRKRAQQDIVQASDNVSSSKTDKPLTPEEEFLQKATACVYAHLSDSDYDRDAFASDMGASQSTLYNKLRAITGQNVITFIRDIRMKEAYKLAQKDPTQRVSDLAYHVGFQDPKYFSTCFKKQFGMQPKEFMERLKN